MAASCGMTLAAEEQAADTAIDPVYEENVRFLTALGILDEDAAELDPSAEVTRGAFALAVGRILGNEGYSEDMQSLFIDMDGQDAEMVAAVNLLAQMNLVSGVGGSSYSPDDSITQEQAIKITVGLLGYDTLAQEKGGFPSGYLLQGMELKLLPSGILNSADPLLQNSFVTLLTNALHTDILQQTSYGTDPVYRVIEGENLLTNIMDILQLNRVMVTGNENTRLNGGEGTRDGMVEIENILYRDSTGNAGEYLGKRVDLYYREDANKDRIVIYVTASQNDENVLEIPLEDIEKLDGYTISYYDAASDAARRITVADAAVMVLNGRAAAYNPEKIDLALSGKIRVEKGTSDRYDLVTVEQYEDFFVDVIDYDRSTLYDKIVSGNFLNLSVYIENEMCDIIDALDGSPLELSDISTETLLAVYRSEDNDYIRISVTTGSVTGTLETLSREEAVIDGQTYEISEEIRLKLEKKLGAECTVYVNQNGKIVYMDDTAVNSMQYGFVIQYSLESQFQDKLSLQVLTETGSVTAYSVASQIILNGSRITNNVPNTVVNILSSGGTFTPQLVQYKLNSDNQIREINTAGTNEATDDLYISYPRSQVRYKNGAMSFGMQFSIDNSTKIFVVSPDQSSDTEDYQLLTSSYFINDSTYDVEGYCSTEGGVVEALVCWDDASNVTPTLGTAIILVDYVSEGVDEEGAPVEYLYGISGGQYVNYRTDGKLKLVTSSGRKLKRGDVVRIARNTQSEIAGMIVDVDIDTQKSTSPSFGSFLGNYWAFSGVVYSVESGYAIVSNTNKENLSDIDFTDPSNLYSLKLSGNVMVYDEEADEIYVGNTGELLGYKSAGNAATRFLARFNYESMRDLVIFKYKE